MGRHSGKTQEVQTQFAMFMDELKRQRSFDSGVRSRAHEMCEEIRKLSRKSNLEIFSKMPKAQREELERNANESRDLLNAKLEVLKSTSLQAHRNDATKQRAIDNAWKKQRIFADPPPPPPDAPAWLKGLLDWLGQHSVRHGQLFAPAYACAGDTKQGQNCFPEVGLLKLSYHISGQGGSWGWEASAEAPFIEDTLVYIYVPEIDGILSASANVHLFGTVLVHSDDHWWSSTEANLDFELNCRIQQGTAPSAYCATPVVKESVSDATNFYSFDQVLQAPCTSFVTANNPVFIAVGASVHGKARSDYATVDVDFSSHNPEKHILVESIDLSLDPAR